MGQSTNDVFPTATRLALLEGAGPLAAGARELADSFHRKAEEFADIVKTGRTHLQDAVPITLGQEMSGYAACLRRSATDVTDAAEQLTELNIGATAVGTGLNAGDDYRALMIEHLATATNLPLKPASNLFRVTQSMGDVLAYSGAMRRLAVELSKIANDLRLLGSGPRAGLGELSLPAVQPGSSIMPGKVNPSMAEMVNQVCYQVIGCDITVTLAAEAGQLELNVMMPVIAWNAIHASTILREAMRAFRIRCVERPDRQRRPRPRAPRSQHRDRDGPQPVHRLRRHRRDRQGGRRHRAIDSRSGARPRPARREGPRSHSLGGRHDPTGRGGTGPGRVGRVGRAGK